MAAQPQRRPRLRKAMPSPPARFSVAASILAGGRSLRMGRDKAQMRLGGRSLLTWVRRVCLEAGFPVRVIRKDRVPRCGPIGGIWTALHHNLADATVFLSCDMPFIRPKDLQQILRAAVRGRGRRFSVFFEDEEGVGFPFLIWRDQMDCVQDQLDQNRYSLQDLAGRLRARRIRLPSPESWRRMNVNTPADWNQALIRLKAIRSRLSTQAPTHFLS